VWEPEPTREPAKPQKQPTPGLKQKEQPKRRKPPVTILAGAAVVGVLAISAVMYVIFGGKHGPPPPTSKPDIPALVSPWPEGMEKPIASKDWTIEPVEGAKTVTDKGKTYFREIELVLNPEIRIRFIFIPQQIGDTDGTSVPAFYLMRDKVSHGLFQRFAKVM